MGLTAINGNPKSVNHRLLMKAFEVTPSLIIDCANCADVHKLKGFIDEEQLDHVYVMNAEAIYRLRDTLMDVPYYIRKHKIKAIFVTTIGTLFSYDDEEENNDIIENCFQRLKAISRKVQVLIALDDKYRKFSDKYIDTKGQ